MGTRIGTAVQRHNRQFYEREFHTDVFRRSVFGLVALYNLLPQALIDIPNVRDFQKRLQDVVLQAAIRGFDGWQGILSGSVIRRQVEFQRLSAA